MLYGASLDQPEAAAAAAIAADNIRGPLLLISGQDDQMWPSTRMADALIARLKANTHPYEFSHLPYAGAGHFSGPPAFSADEALGGGPFNLGGSPAGNAGGPRRFVAARPRFPAATSRLDSLWPRWAEG
jgi:dienelactone hydrolase